MRTVNIIDVVGENCITFADGQKVYELIYPELKAKHPVELDFAGVKVFITRFFNAAIGQLLHDIDVDDLNSFLRLSNLSPVGRDVVKRVIENAKQYYSNATFRKAVDEVLNQQEEE